jgi:hypothetical protein
MSQTDRLANLLRGGEWHDTVEIQRVVYGRDHLGTARIASRICDIKKRYGWDIESRRVLNSATVWEYRIKAKGRKAS